MNEMVERIARSIRAVVATSNDWDRIGDAAQEMYRRDACAAIKAMRDPTDAMRVAALSATFDEKRGDRVYADDVPIIWRAMIDAALLEKYTRR